MNYSKFKGKKLKSQSLDTEDLIYGVVARIFLVLGFTFILLTCKDMNFLFVYPACVSIFLGLGLYLDNDSTLFWVSLLYAIKNHKTISDYEIEKIKEKLFIEELPNEIDLAYYFKEREIELLEAEVNGDIDLMKLKYLKGVRNEIR